MPFDPSFAGQMNVYLSAADDLLRHPDDRPTIGLLLCRAKNKVVVELADRAEPTLGGSPPAGQERCSPGQGTTRYTFSMTAAKIKGVFGFRWGARRCQTRRRKAFPDPRVRRRGDSLFQCRVEEWPTPEATKASIGRRVA